MKLPGIYEGEIVHGFGRGHKMLGFATANLDTNSWDDDITEEDYGVYCGFVQIKSTKKNKNKGNQMICVVSIGKNPTFNVRKPAFEVHILDFDNDIYSRIIRVELVEKLRPLVQFKSIDDLKMQIAKDKETAQKKMDSLLLHRKHEII